MAYQQMRFQGLDQSSDGAGYRKELTSIVCLDVPSICTLKDYPYDSNENEGKSPVDTQGIRFLQWQKIQQFRKGLNNEG